MTLETHSPVSKGHKGDVFSVAFHPTDPDIVATGSADTTAKIWNRKTGECIS